MKNTEQIVNALRDKMLRYAKLEQAELSESEYSEWLENSILKKFKIGLSKLEDTKEIIKNCELPDNKVLLIMEKLDDIQNIFGALIWHDDNPALWAGDTTDIGATPASNWTTIVSDEENQPKRLIIKKHK